MDLRICISEDFSETPGARLRSEGSYSGEEFRETMLKDKYLKARESGDKLVINLDGGYGYPTSFLEEAFGGLAREFGSSEVLAILEFESNDEPALIDEIKSYITNANKKSEASHAKDE